MEVWRSLMDGMAQLLNMLYQVTVKIGLPSYALAIVILTISIKMILYPLTKKQMQSMVIMQRLQPKITEIQDKWKKRDPKKAQELIMQLYKDNNASPMAGCLPLLIQMPILIALYRTLFGFTYINEAHAGFIWISSLSAKDPLMILPVLAAVTTFLQAKMTMTASDPTQRMMLYMMPLVIGWISLNLPSGMVLYWVVFNIVGMAQQYYINKQTLPLREGATGK